MLQFQCYLHCTDLDRSPANLLLNYVVAALARLHLSFLPVIDEHLYGPLRLFLGRVRGVIGHHMQYMCITSAMSEVRNEHMYAAWMGL